jgi:outer membrane murein-binding lipoprotein Lpp
MADLSALTDAINQLSTDVQTLIAASGSTDQAAVDLATSQLQALDAQVLAATTTAPKPAVAVPDPGTVS